MKSSRIDWQPFTRKTFELASDLRRPVLLYLRSVDCRLCLTMEEDVLNRQQVVDKVAGVTVPIAVDVDLRPDLAARYVVGAVPTLVFLLPNGEPMYQVEDASSLERVGGYFATVDGLKSYITQVEEYFLLEARTLSRKAREVAELERDLWTYEAGPVPFNRSNELLERLRQGLDFTNGGYGRNWKFISDGPIRLFRLQIAAGDEPGLRRAVAATAAGMLSGEIHDRVDGGFHHFATTRDWNIPALEKRLLVNGRALRLLVAAGWLAPEDKALREGLVGTASFIMDTLMLDDGSVAFSQQGSLGTRDPGSYFQADAEGRQTLRPPPLVARQLTESMAVAATGLMEAGSLLQDESMEQAGLSIVDRISRKHYAPGRGVARYLDGKGEPRQRGMLADQVAAMEALITAYQVRGASADLERALELLRFCQGNLRNPAGYFIDRVEDAEAAGMLRRPQVPVGLNGSLALAAFRLAAITGEPSLRRTGEDALGALSSAIPRMDGPTDSPYGEALMAASQPVVRVILGAEVSSGMRRAALLMPVAGSVVMRDESEAGPGKGTLVCVARECSAPVTQPAELAAALDLARSAAKAKQDEAGEDDPVPGSGEEKE